MKHDYVNADTFYIKKHKLRIYRVKEPKTATVLFVLEQQAIQYVQKLHVQKLMKNKKIL